MPLHAQAALKTLIKDEFPSLSAFARQCGISQSLVWRDCEDRVMSDTRFGKYLRNLSPEGRERLIRARVRDILPAEFESLVEVEASPLPKKRSNFVLLSEETRDALELLAGEMARDPELEDWVKGFIRKVC